MLKSRLRFRRKPRFRARTVIELFNDGEPVLRVDLPTVIEEDEDGIFPMVHVHDRSLETLEIDRLSVTMRHRQIDE